MFCDRLENAIKNKKITGNKLCEKLGIDNKNYTNWKRNKIPSGERLKEIADELNVSVDWLLERDNALNERETKLIENYRNTNETGKRTIETIAELQAQEQQLLTSGNGYKEKSEA